MCGGGSSEEPPGCSLLCPEAGLGFNTSVAHAAVVPVSVLQPPFTWSHVKALISVSCTLFNQMSVFAVITLILVIQLSSFQLSGLRANRSCASSFPLAVTSPWWHARCSSGLYGCCATGTDCDCTYQQVMVGPFYLPPVTSQTIYRFTHYCTHNNYNSSD